MTSFIKKNPSLRKKCPYSELFWSAFSSIWTEYGEIQNISPYSVRMWENKDQNNSKYGHFLRSAGCKFLFQTMSRPWGYRWRVQTPTKLALCTANLKRALEVNYFTWVILRQSKSYDLSSLADGKLEEI